MTERPGLGRSVFVGLVVGAVVLAVGGLVQMIGWSTSWLRTRDLHGGLVGVLAIVLLRPVVDACARWAGGDRAVPAAWFGIAGAAVGLGFGTAMHLDHAFQSTYRFLRAFNSFWEMEPETFLAPMAATVVAAVAYRREGQLDRPARLPRLRVLAIVATGAAAVFALLGSLRAAHAPTMRDYFESLESVGVAPSVSARGASLPTSSADGGVSVAYDDQAVGPFTLRRYQFERGWHCIPRLTRDRNTLPERITRSYAALVPCGAVELRRDASHHLYLLHDPNQEYGPGPAAFDDRSLEPIPEHRLSNSLIADGLALPRSWLAVSWMLIAMAAYAALRPSYAHRWLVHRSAWRSGTLERDGIVRFDDGSASSPAPATVRLGPGKVVVLDVNHAQAGTPFRDRAAQPPIEASNIVKGDVESFAEALRYDLAAHEARALAIALAVLSILAAAASVRLVV